MATAVSVEAQPSSAGAALGPRASIAGWLGVLFVLLMLLYTVGGYVRLSGSGLSIPDWPLIWYDDERCTLLPPFADGDWAILRDRFEADQDRLRDARLRGVPGIGSLGRVPHDLPTFKTMFLIEWSHRFLAAIVAVVAGGCCAVAMRRRELRGEIGPALGTICGLIAFQAVLGGLLVRSGTATHWLFLHLGTAAIILCCTAWAILRLLSAERPALAPEVAAARRPLRRWATAALVLAWCQIVLGAMVAGSRGDVHGSGYQFSKEWPTMLGGQLVPELWIAERPLGWNLLDNAFLHQWTHRWFAWLVVGALVATWIAARRARCSPRLSLALRATAACLIAQVALGLGNVFMRHPAVLSLAHLVMGMVLLVTIVLVVFDARSESPEPQP